MTSPEYDQCYRELLSDAISQDLTIEEARLQFDALMNKFPSDPEVRFEPFSIGDLPAVWAFAPDVTRRRILLFFHGGSFSMGSIESHKNLIGRLSAAAHAAVCAIQYRLAPEHPYPSALDDALTAYRWLLHHPYARSRIILTGFSAGAGLLLSLFLRLQKERIALPAAGILLCPWIDLTLQSKTMSSNRTKDVLKAEWLTWSAEKYANGMNMADPLLSPIYGDLEGLPPLFIQTGTLDILNGDAILLADRARKKEVEVTLDVWPDMIHGWQMFAPKFPEAQEAIERAGQFVEKLFKDRLEQAGH